MPEGWRVPGEMAVETLDSIESRAEAGVREALLRRTQNELRSLRSVASVLSGRTAGPADRLAARWHAAIVEVLPFADPSPSRRALWVSLHGVELPSRTGASPWAAGVSGVGGAPQDAAAVSGDRLIGRLVDTPSGALCGRIQTVEDPFFRVRFRIDDTLGVLWGTGRRTTDGRPLLEVHHRTTSSVLEAGTVLVTAGDDGIFPPGLAIGEVAQESAVAAEERAGSAEDGGGDLTLVAAYPLSSALHELVLLTDRARRDLALRRAADRERGER